MAGVLLLVTLIVALEMHTGGAVRLSANTRSRRRRWVQNECRGLGEADAPEVDPVLQRATAALRARPVLLCYCAEEVPCPHNHRPHPASADGDMCSV